MTYASALPDPDTQPEFYADIPTKRLLAWGVDVILAAVMTAAVVPLTLFTGLFYLPFLYAMVSFVYRWVTIANGGGTWGMRLMSVELRGPGGLPLGMQGAFLHTLGYAVSVSMFPLQLISVGLMLMTPRAQGLTDHVLGTVALNRSATRA